MQKFIKLVVSIIICQLAGVIGSVFTVKNITSWYLDLIKPSLNLFRSLYILIKLYKI